MPPIATVAIVGLEEVERAVRMSRAPEGPMMDFAFALLGACYGVG